MYQNKYTDINQIEYEQLKELGIKSYDSSLERLKMFLKGDASYRTKLIPEMVGKDFLEMTTEEIMMLKECIYCFGNSAVDKTIWLQKYLKGEITGKFKSEIKSIEISEKENRISSLLEENRNLRKRIKELELENKSLKLKDEKVERKRQEIILLIEKLKDMGD